MTEKFDFNDILIEPATISRINSRKDINPYHDGFLPLITAPMDTVIGPSNEQLFFNQKINVCLPRGEKTSLGFESYSLQEIFKLWKGLDKVIINISSRHTNSNGQYSRNKKKIDEYCEKNVYNLPKIINLKPGLVDTDRVKNIKNIKMTTQDVIDILDFCLKSKVKVHSISFGL